MPAVAVLHASSGARNLSHSRKRQAFDLRRREFLIRSVQGASAAFVPAGLRGLGLNPGLLNALGGGVRTQEALALDSVVQRSPGGEYHLHPHYRMPLPVDPLLAKTQAGLDEFISEKYADQIAAILNGWSASLLRSSSDVTAFEKVLLPDFTGASLRPASSRTVRKAPIEVRRCEFASSPLLNREAFLVELRQSMTSFSQLDIAEMQVTSISGAESAGTGAEGRRSDARIQLTARVRYELVGTIAGGHRQQRIGAWNLVCESLGQADVGVRSWLPVEETQSRCATTVYEEITDAAFSNNASYSAQLAHGSDYWRTVLDAACGIDIYGHNGVSVGDIDGDGFDDLYICQPGGLPNRLFRNRGDGTLEDVTEEAGVGVIENTACALFVDVTNSGRQDLIVVRSNGPLLFLNDGRGRFRQKANAFQFTRVPQGTFTGAAVADYDRDGWLDIYFCLYIYYQGAEQYKYPSPYFDANNGPPNFMMRNHRDGTFRDVTAETGLNANNTRYSFCCGWNDFNGDGWPDLYVVNDFGRKNLYRNNGDGTFTDVAAEAGVEDVGAGMSVCWFDYDNDGAEDLYVANMWTAAGERVTMQDEFKKSSPTGIRNLYHKHAMGNSLFHNSGRGVGDSPGQVSSAFADRTDSSGVRVGRWSWSSDAFDFDHDGFPDLYVTNGMVSGPDREDLNSFFWRQVVAKSPDQAQPSHDYEQGWGAINELIRSDRTWSGYERNIFYANNGDGTFSDVSGVVGLDFIEDGRSFALADFDLDGRQEIFLKNRNGPQLRALRNVLRDLPPSISFRLQGTKSNRDAIGSVVTVTLEGPVTRQTRSLQAGSGFLAQHSKDVFFGLGFLADPSKTSVTAQVRWPSGLIQKFRDLPVNHRIWLEEGNSAPKRVEEFRTPRNLAETRPIRHAENFPDTAETWLLAPIAAPDFSLSSNQLSAHFGAPVLLHFGSRDDARTQKDWSNFADRYAGWHLKGLHVISIDFGEESAVDASTKRLPFPILQGNDDVAAINNILFRNLFDRHHDITLPASFLIDSAGEIVKVYQGPADPDHVEHDFQNMPRTPADRLARALPFPGVTEVVEFGRNYLSFGSVYFQRGYLEQAETFFQVAWRDDPESAEALYGIGSVQLNQQRNAEARDCFARALKSRASYPDTLANSWNNLGLLAGREGKIEEAITDFEQALRLSPTHLIALNNLGGAFRQGKRWNDALETYQKALEIKPADADANYGLAMVYAQQGETGRAEDYLKRTLALRPDYPEALNNLGILYLRTQRRDEAVGNFQESIRAAPDFDQAYLNLARVHAIEGDKEQARAVLEELLKRHPDHAAALQMLSQLK